MKYLRRGLAVLVVSMGALVAFRPDDRLFELAKNLEIFATLFRELNTNYVDEINPTKTIRVGIDAMLKSLDPYTNFYPEDMIEDARTLMAGKYNGIGASVVQMNGQRVISMLFEDSPALKAGLKIGDAVLKINGMDIAKRSDDELARLLKGQTGTSLTLTIQRLNEPKPFDIRVTRAVVKTPNVPHFGMLTPEVGYIQLKDFSETAAKEVKSAMVELKEKGMKQLVLDLRGNPGGYLVQAVEIVNFFVPKGKLVVETRGKVTDSNMKYATKDDPIEPEMPVVVLISSKSASASEIVAGALQDYDRGVLIGQRSFGKGLVQVTKPLTYNTQAKFTIAKYYIPSGRCIQALDYSHRNEDGSVGKVPDSLKTPFTTKNGRIFYDGGGVEPDIPTAEFVGSGLAKELQLSGKIFDFATKYYYENTDKKNENLFELSENEYQQFVKWALNRPTSYQSDLEKQLHNLEQLARSEGLSDEVRAGMESIRTKIAARKQGDFEKYKQEIKEMLALEIVGRYHLTNAARFISFEKDREVQAALQVLKTPSRYQQILKK